MNWELVIGDSGVTEACLAAFVNYHSQYFIIALLVLWRVCAHSEGSKELAGENESFDEAVQEQWSSRGYWNEGTISRYTAVSWKYHEKVRDTVFDVNITL